MFSLIASFVDIFPEFMCFLQAFGFKLEAEDENFGGCQKRVLKPDCNTPGMDFGTILWASYCWSTRDILTSTNDIEEIMYNLRYVDKHNRELNNPWSLRQTAVYQKYTSETRASTWILLQPSEQAYKSLRNNMATTGNLVYDISIFWLHNIIFRSTEKNWRHYINYLQSNFQSLVRLTIS